MRQTEQQIKGNRPMRDAKLEPYILVNALTDESLKQRVAVEIDLGYRPIGGPVIDANGQWIQAMVPVK